MVELRDVFEFASFLTFNTSKTRFRTPRASLFSFYFDEGDRRGAFSHSFYLLCPTDARRVGANNTAIRRKRRAFSAPSTSYRRRFLFYCNFGAKRRSLSQSTRLFFEKTPKKRKKEMFFAFFFVFRPFLTRRFKRRRRFFLVWRQIGSRRRDAFCSALRRERSRKKTVARPAKTSRRSTDSLTNATSETAAFFT